MTFGRYYPGGPKCIKLFLHLSFSTGELFWVILCPFLCIVTFLMFVYFLRTNQLLHIIFCKCSWYCLEGYLTKKNLFIASLPLLGAILRYFGDVLFYFWELFPILSYEFLCRCFLYYSYSQFIEENFTTLIPLLGSIRQYFWAYFGYIT